MKIEMSIPQNSISNGSKFSSMYFLKENIENEKEDFYQLFSKAITYQNNYAWALIQNKYHDLIRLWVLQNAFGLCDDDLEDLIQNTFSRFWLSLTKNGTNLEEKFVNLGSILQYLKICAVSTSIDFLRKQQRRRLLDQKLMNDFIYDEERHIDCYDEPSDLMRQLQKWVAKSVQDPKERLLLKLLFEYNLKPAQIVNKFPKEFPTARDVNRIRERVLKRARRAFC